MLNKTDGKFTFSIPAPHSQAGEKVEGTFDYVATENDADVQSVLAEREWSLTDVINDILYSNAMANARAKALGAYKTTKTPEQLRQDSIDALVKSGLSVAIATQAIDSALSLK